MINAIIGKDEKTMKKIRFLALTLCLALVVSMSGSSFGSADSLPAFRTAVIAVNLIFLSSTDLTP